MNVHRPRSEAVIQKSQQPSSGPGTGSADATSSAASDSGVAPTALPTNLSVPSAALPPSAVGLSEPGSLEPAYTAAELFRDFPDDDVCLEYIKERIWPKGLAPCLKCGMARKHYRVSGRKAYACNHCGHHIYPLAGTIFSKSTTPLRTWFYILYLMLSTRGMLSARQIQRETGVTYKTAWRSRGQILGLLPLVTAGAPDLDSSMGGAVPPDQGPTNESENG